MLYVNPLEARRTEGLGTMADTPANRKAALEELERLFLFTLLKEMRKTSSIGGKDERTAARRLYDEMFDDAISGEIAKSGRFGLAQQIEEQLEACRVKPAAELDGSSRGPGVPISETETDRLAGHGRVPWTLSLPSAR